MRTKVTLVLVFLNVALFFFIFKFERQWRTEAASLEARRRVLGAEAADIRSIQVTSEAAGGSFTLVKRQDMWLLSSPLDWPANPHAVRSILDELQLLENEISFPVQDLAKSGQSLAEFGLDTPSVTIAFTSGDVAAGRTPTPTVLRLGDTTKTGKRLYLLSPDGERIHVVNRAHLGSVMLAVDQLRADTLLTIPVFEAQALNIQTSTVDATRAAATTNVRTSIRLEGGRWKFDAPITDRANKTALEDTINRLNALRPKAFVSAPTGPAPSAAPTLRIGLEGNNRRETLFLGEPVAPATPTAPPSTTTDYYAQVGDRSAVFTVAVSADLIQALRNAPEKLREKRFLDFTPASVTSLILAEPVQPNQAPLTLQRLEAAPADAATRDGAWQLVRRGDATQGLQTVPADAPSVQRLLARLARLEARAENGFVSDNPSGAQLESWGFNRPDREVTLTFPAAPASPGAPATTTLVLQLGTDTNRNVFARVGSDPRASVYAVEAGILDEIPLSPLDWRDRQVLTVPANGRIAALKLAHLGTKQTLLDTTPDAAGQPTVAGRAPEAVTQLAEQLRSVRAQRFLAGSLTDRIFVGGAEREWTYQLDVTVTLPGGATGSQTAVRTFLLTERVGGTEQFAGDRVLDAVFQLEQPVLDALSRLTLRDPGPPADTPRDPNAK